MDFNLKRNSKMLELVRTHLVVDRFFGSTLKMLAKEVSFFDVFYV